MGTGWQKGKYPDFEAEKRRRQRNFLRIRKSGDLIRGSKKYYKDKPVEWIMDWAVTYDPRNSGGKKGAPTLMPFILFDRQIEFIKFLYGLWEDKENGACEKCRDGGITWCAAAFTVWLWLYHEGSSIGWGSRKEILVDKIGDPDSIFEKIRKIIRNLPAFMKPHGFNEREHTNYMKIVNPENESTITGEAGDNIGRGGRKTIYFKDESAHYTNSESIEAALGDNTNSQVDISSVNGPDTAFQRKINTGEEWKPDREPTPGEMRVFIFDWTDHPLKDKEWYDKRRAKAEREGLLHKFAQEVDRDASASVEGSVIPQEWVHSAIDAHIKLGIEIDGMAFGGLDVADEGKDNHALAIRRFILLQFCEEWYKGDGAEAAQMSLFHCKRHKVSNLGYDCIGVGATVKSEINRLDQAKLIPKWIKILGWNASARPLFPKARLIRGDRESPKNKDFFDNLKAQAWWQLRVRFEKTHKMVRGEADYPHDELISISSEIKDIVSVKKQLSQATFSTNRSNGKMVINKAPGSMKSPNLADSIVMSYWPITRMKMVA